MALSAGLGALTYMLDQTPLSALAAATACLALGLLVLRRLDANSLQRQVQALGEQARRLESGALPVERAVAADSLLGPLDDTLRQALRGVQTHLDHITQRLGERDAMLASMVEGVLALDAQGGVLELNPAAGRMFDLDPARARGRDLLEVVRNPELQRFIRSAQASPASLEHELTLYGTDPRTLQIRATALRDRAGQVLGTLLVLHDVTHLRRLERMRQDFVANVSHEIKTPITSIKGSVETLLDGAAEDPVASRRFLEIISRHAERLHAITEDLLKLSRVEQEAAEGELHAEHVGLAGVLSGAISLCAGQAEARSIRLELDCAEHLTGRLNAQLVEQAVVNLVENAVKYAPSGTRVRVQGRREPTGVAICVQDEGPGIPAEHLPRLFERFYRVDKARSRKAGGTGLGLAIVKHIAQAHGGWAEVQSVLGRGSVFSLHLPDARPS